MHNPVDYTKACTEASLLASAAVIKQLNSTDYRHQYLLNTIQLGPRWPALLLNPVNKTQIKLTSNSLNLNTDNLKAHIQEAIAKDIMPRSNILLRKFKKLKNSPMQFFKDMN